MADNTTLPSGSGGDTLRSEDRGSYKTPVSLIDVGGVAGEALIGDGTNAMPIKDGGNSITVDATTLPLPTGASTAANQTNIYAVLEDLSQALTSVSTDTLEVVVNNVVPITDNAGSLTVDGTVAATQSGTWNITNVSGTVTLPTGAATEQSLTDILSVLNGSVSINDGAGSLTVDAVSLPLPTGASTAAHQVTQNSSLSSIDGYVSFLSGWDSGTGVAANVVVFSALPAGTNNIGDVDILTLPALPSGTNNIGDVDVLTLPALPAGTNAIGSVNTSPTTVGGWDMVMMTSGDGSTALTNTAQAIKASAGKLGGWYIYNPNATAAYVMIYNVAHGSVTVGTTNAQMVLCIPATSGANIEMTNGVAFSTAISVAAATTGGGNTAPSTALEANFWYK